jgi:hypothetical protein
MKAANTQIKGFPKALYSILMSFREYKLFRIVRAEWPQCRRCQALGYWGSGNLEWVGQMGEGWGK